MEHTKNLIQKKHEDEGDIPIECIDLKTGKRFTKRFGSLFSCRKFVKKCEHSPNILVVVHPNFD